MRKALWCALAIIPMMAGTVSAQMMARGLKPITQGYVDPKPVMEAAARTMDIDKLKCVTYSGSGNVGGIGQNRFPMDDWPRLKTQYSRTINFEAKTSREEQLRQLGDDPDLMNETTLVGTGVGERVQGGLYKQVLLTSPNYAWNMVGNTVVPEPTAAEQRQLDIVLTPHGFLKAAMAADKVTAITRLDEGRIITVLSIQVGKYRVNGSVDELNFVERVQTWVPSPVLGDMMYDNYFTVWKDFGGIKFPTRFHHHWGPDDERRTPRWFNGYNAFNITMDNVQTNACGEPVQAPAVVRNTPIPAQRVDVQKLADGVWYMGGATHNSVAVEFKNYVAVFEAPLDEDRSLAVIKAIQQLVPAKPIQYVVNTHHHFDHLGGVRTYAQAGAAIITHVWNRDFYWHDLLSNAQRTLQPDILSLYPPEEIIDTGYVFEAVSEKYILSDGARTMEIYHVQGIAEKNCRLTQMPGTEGCDAELSHSETMLMAYLPNEKIILEADLYNPQPAGAPPIKPGDGENALYDNVKALGIDVATIAPVHGRPVPWSEFAKFMGKTQ